MNINITDQDVLDTISEIVWYIDNVFNGEKWNISDIHPEELLLLITEYPSDLTAVNKRNKNVELYKTLISKNIIWKDIIAQGNYNPNRSSKSFEKSPIWFAFGYVGNCTIPAQKVLGGDFLINTFNIKPITFLQLVLKSKIPKKPLLKKHILRALTEIRPEISQENLLEKVSDDDVLDNKLILTLLTEISLKTDVINARTENIEEIVKQIRNHGETIEELIEIMMSSLDDLEMFLKDKLSSDWEKIKEKWDNVKEGGASKKDFLKFASKSLIKKIFKLVSK